MLGAALDSSGAGRGEQRAPAALRAAGLVEAFGAVDASDADAALDDPRRDPVTGLVGFAGLVTATSAIRKALAPNGPRRRSSTSS